MEIVRKRICELIPAPYNPRKDIRPGDSEYEKLRRSLEEFGYVEPVIWNAQTGHVVGGHQRLKVLRELGETEAGRLNGLDVIQSMNWVTFTKKMEQKLFSRRSPRGQEI